MVWSIESVRTANLAPADIFSLYTDPSTWGSWGHNTRGAYAEGPVVEGSIVHVEAGYRRTWDVLVRHLDPNHFIDGSDNTNGVVGFVSNMTRVHATKGGRHAGQFNHFFRLGEGARYIEKPRGQAKSARLHPGPNQILHLDHLL